MATIIKYLLTCGAVTLGGMVGLSYTKPSWTCHKFSQDRCLPIKQNMAPSRQVCVHQLNSFNNPDAPLDVLVIGGGCVGSGIALDAVTRGLQVGLVQKFDYASQTSSRSTKLIHGGIRYLQKAIFQLDWQQLKLVAQALRERSIMLHQAPHLCHPLPTLVPCYSVTDIGMFWLGTKMYDLIAALYGGTINFSQFVFPQTLRTIYPALHTQSQKHKRLLGAVRYFDGQLNDARLGFTVAMTAAAYGAAVANYMQVMSVNNVTDAMGNELVKVKILDRISHNTLQVYTKSVVNAGGPFTTQIEQLVHGAAQKIEMIPAMGVHLVLNRRYGPVPHEGMVVPSSDGRVIFSIPWLGGCLVGTTDHPCQITNDPHPPRQDVQFLLRSIEPYVGPVSVENVKSVWAGIRPLARPSMQKMNNGDTQNVVREHLISVDPPRHLLSIAGGKWTTYRKMAEEATNQLVATLLKGQTNARPCCTEQLVMVGARYLNHVPTQSAAREQQIPADVHEHWKNNYGDYYPKLSSLAHDDEDKYLVRLTDNCPVTEAEVLWCTKYEHCEHVMDFIARRTRIAFVDSKQALTVIPRVAQLMATVKQWSSTQKQEEIKLAQEGMLAFESN